MKILVTGANGFVGRHVVCALKAAGHEVLGCVRTKKADDDSDFVLVDLLHDSASVLSGVDVVVHTAGMAHHRAAGGADLASLFHEGNYAVTAALADAVSRSEVRALIHLSSIAAAGFTEFSEQSGLSESLQRDPTSEYGKSKRLAEAPVEKLSQVGKLGVNLRPPLIYGSGARGNWPLLVQLAKSPLPLPFGSVKNRRSFLGIGNLVERILAIIECSDRVDLSGTYHIADREIISLSELVTALRSGMGRKPGLVPFPPDLMKKMLQWMRRSSMAEGLFGDLVVDARRVREAFPLASELPTLDGIKKCVSPLQKIR